MSLIIVNKEWCKKCRICIDLCPNNALISDEEGYPKLMRSYALDVNYASLDVLILQLK